MDKRGMTMNNRTRISNNKFPPWLWTECSGLWLFWRRRPSGLTCATLRRPSRPRLLMRSVSRLTGTTFFGPDPKSCARQSFSLHLKVDLCGQSCLLATCPTSLADQIRFQASLQPCLQEACALMLELETVIEATSEIERQ